MATSQSKSKAKPAAKKGLVTKAQKEEAKAAAQKKKGDGNSTRVAIPTRQHFEKLDAEIQVVQTRAFKSFKEEDFIELRALYDRGYRWARKLYETDGLAEQSKVATKAADQAAKAS